jgi:hypothetical protein
MATEAFLKAREKPSVVQYGAMMRGKHGNPGILGLLESVTCRCQNSKTGSNPHPRPDRPHPPL